MDDLPRSSSAINRVSNVPTTVQVYGSRHFNWVLLFSNISEKRKTGESAWKVTGYVCR